MEDGQVADVYAPDRAEEDPADVEHNGDFPSSEPAAEEESSDESTDSEDHANDADTEAADIRGADTDAAAQGGTPDPSFQQFLAKWSDDDNFSNTGDSAAL